MELFTTSDVIVRPLYPRRSDWLVRDGRANGDPYIRNSCNTSRCARPGSIEVITSPWAYVVGIPLATLGGVYYLTTIGLALWWFDTRHPLLIKILTPITASGVAFSAYFVYLQLGVIGEICPFCMMSAAATVVLFGLELAILRQSTTPSLSRMGSDLSRVLTETNVAVVVFPILMGLVTIAGLFLVPLLPLPDAVQFV